MKKIHFLFLLFSSPIVLYSQLVVDNSVPYDDVSFLIDDVLLSSQVQSSNHNFHGDPIQIAFFDGSNSNLGFDAGIVISTGGVAPLSPGFQNPQDLVNQVPLVTDPDLLNIANSVPPLIGQAFSVNTINDIAILEFEFIPSGNEINFRYIFATAEYFAFENTEFNDVFGFFLSGPGITGPYASPAGYPNGSINIATFESQENNSLGAILPITVSSVNAAYNAQYFVGNQAMVSVGGADGFTVPMIASAEVQCGETYHIRLAIADGTDNVLSSYVLFEKNSFSSGSGGITNSLGQDTSHILVDCGEEVTLTAEVESDIDYDVLWNTNDTSLSILVGPGSYWFQASNDNCVIKSDTVVVEWPSSTFSLDTSICVTDRITVRAITDGQPPFTYLWSTGQTTSQIIVGPGHYSVASKGVDNCEVITEINVNEIETPTAVLRGDGRFCDGEVVDVPLNILFTGQPPFSFTYTDGTNLYHDNSNSLAYIIRATQFGNYQLTDLKDAFCKGIFSGESTISEIPLPTTHIGESQLICTGDSAEIVVEVNTDLLPFSVYINNGYYDKVFTDLTHSPFSFFTTDSGTYTVKKAVDSNGCISIDNKGSATISHKELLNPDITTNIDTIVCAVDPPIVLEALTPGGVWRGKGVGLDQNFHPNNAYLGGNWIYYSFPYNCQEKDSISIEVGCHLQIFIPNSFTPNGDKINDFFLIRGKNVISFEMSIYNRWGEQVFSTTDINTFWDGTFNQETVQTGVYTYHFKAYGKDAQLVSKSGTVNLIR